MRDNTRMEASIINGAETARSFLLSSILTGFETRQRCSLLIDRVPEMPEALYCAIVNDGNSCFRPENGNCSYNRNQRLISLQLQSRESGSIAQVSIGCDLMKKIVIFH